MKNFLKSLFGGELKLTKEEQKIKDIVETLLSKEDTKIEQEHQANSFLLSNKRLDCFIELNGTVMIASGNGLHSRSLRLNVIEFLKTMTANEETRRYKENKEIVFNKGLSLLDTINENIK